MRLKVGDRVRYIRTEEDDLDHLIGEEGTVVGVDADNGCPVYLCRVAFDAYNCITFSSKRYELISRTHMHDPVFTLEEINAYA